MGLVDWEVLLVDIVVVVGVGGVGGVGGGDMVVGVALLVSGVDERDLQVSYN